MKVYEFFSPLISSVIVTHSVLGTAVLLDRQFWDKSSRYVCQYYHNSSSIIVKVTMLVVCKEVWLTLL